MIKQFHYIFVFFNPQNPQWCQSILLIPLLHKNFKNTWYMQQTHDIPYQIFLKFKKSMKVVFCKDDFSIIFFFEIRRKSCHYKRQLLTKFFLNLKNTWKTIRSRFSQRRFSREKSYLKKTTLEQSIFQINIIRVMFGPKTFKKKKRESIF